MSHTPLDSRIICSTRKVWYIAVAGRETLPGAMTNLHEFVTRVERDRVWSAIIDMRRLTGYPPESDWSMFCDRVRVTMPAGMHIAVLGASELPSEPLEDFIRAGRAGGAAMKGYCSWAQAIEAVGLPPTIPEPLVDPEDVFYLA